MIHIIYTDSRQSNEYQIVTTVPFKFGKNDHIIASILDIPLLSTYTARSLTKLSDY